MAGKKEVKITFLADERFAQWLTESALQLDRNKSEVIRASLLLGLPAVLSMPSLSYKVDFQDRTVNPIIIG